MKRLLILAFTLYLLLAPLTYHPDNKLVLHWASFEHGTVWNIYQFQDQHPDLNARFNYPPVHYFLAKAQFLAGSVIAGSGFSEWLQTPNELDAFEAALMRYMLAIKIVLVLSCLGVGYLLYALVIKVTGGQGKGKLAAALWLFNPITFYSVIMMGQNDVLAIILFLGGWYLLLGKKWWLSPLLFALSIGVKFYPLLWLLILLAGAAQLSVKKRIGLLLLTLFLSAATLVPYLGSPAFRANVLQSSINERFFVPQIAIGFEEVLFIIPMLLVLAFALVLRFDFKAKMMSTFRLQAIGLLIANSVLLGFAHFHPQWFSWLIPFWAIVIVTETHLVRKRIMLWLSLIAFIAWLLVVILFKDAYLSWGILLPLRSDLIFLPKIYDVLMAKGQDTARLISLVHTILAGLSLASFCLLLPTQVTPDGKIAKKTWYGLPTIKSKPLLITTALLLPVLLSFSFIFVTQLFSIPIIGQTMGEPQYAQLLKTQMYTHRTSPQGSLKRIDLAMRNPGLSNTADLVLSLKNEQGVTLQAVPFSGRNIGDPALMRFDLVQIMPPNTLYQVEITSSQADTNPVLLGLDQSASNMIWMRTYTKVTQPLSYALNSTIQKLSQLVPLMWWWFALLSIMLYLLLRQPMKK